MGRLFEYFCNHTIETYKLEEIMPLMKCENPESFKKQFRLYVESILNNKRSTKEIESAKTLARQIQSRDFDMFKSDAFFNYWSKHNKRLTRSMTYSITSKSVLQQTNYQHEIINSLNDADTFDDADTEDNTDVDKAQQTSQPPAFVKVNFPSHDEDNSYSSGADTDKEPKVVAQMPLQSYYLTCTEGDYSFKLESTSKMWVLKSSFNVSEALIAFRDSCIEKAEDLEELDEIEELALNGVILVDDTLSEQAFIPYNQVENIYDEVDKMTLLDTGELDDHEKEILDTVVKESKKLGCGSENVELFINTWMQKYIDKKPLQFAAMLTSLSNIFCGGPTKVDNEATLVRNSIDPFFQLYLKNTPLYKSIGADKVIAASEKRFTSMDPGLHHCGKRADFSIVSSRSNHMLFCLEAKTTSNNNGDFMKLVREMKDSIKSMNASGYDNVTTCGLLLTGSLCKSYMMDHSYDGLYRLFLMDQFRIPTSRFEMSTLYDIIPAFKTISYLVKKTGEILMTNKTKASQPPAPSPSMHTPIKIGRTKRLNLNVGSSQVKNARRRLF